MNKKVSIRFFNDREVRAVWNEANNELLFSVLDVVAVIRNEDNYEKNLNYWKYLKAKLKKKGNELGSDTRSPVISFLAMTKSGVIASVLYFVMTKK